MIIVNGKASGSGQTPQAVDVEELAKLLGGMLSEKIQGAGQKTVVVNRNGEETEVVEDENSLKNIAEIMAQAKDIEKTNIKEIGKTKSITGSKEKKKTINLLNNIPD